MPAIMKLTLTGETRGEVRPGGDTFPDRVFPKEVAKLGGPVELQPEELDTILPGGLVWCFLDGKERLLVFPDETYESLMAATYRYKAEW